MSHPSAAATWIWDPDSRQYYWYDSRTNEVVFESGRRVRHPANPPTTSSPRTLPAQPSSTSSANQVAESRRGPGNYTVQRAAPHALSSVDQPVRTSSLQNPRSTDQVSNATRGLESLVVQQPPQQPGHHPARQTGQTPLIPPTGHQRPAQTPLPARTAVHGAAQGAAQPPTGQAAWNRSDNAGSSQSTDRITAQTRIETHTEEDGTTVREDTVTGVVTRISPDGRLLETDGDCEELFDTFQKRSQPRKFFVEGRVFFILWAEPAGESTVTAREESLGRYGQRIFSKVRRFVVIRESSNFCVCLGIWSLRDQGVAKNGVKKSDFSIIYTSKTPPEPKSRERPVEGEAGMRPFPIRVSPDDPSDKLSEMSRLDYSKPYTVHHNVKVRNLGVVHPHSMGAVKLHYRDVWDKKSVTEYPPELISRAPVALGQPGSSRGNTASNAPATLREQQPRERRDSTSARSKTSDNSQNRREARTRLEAARSRGSRERDSDEDQDDSEDDEEEDQRRPSTSLQASARAAVQRLVQRGFSEERAIDAVRRQLASRPAIQEEASDSGEGSESDHTNRTKHSGPSGRDQQRARRMSQTQTALPPRSSSRPLDPRQAQGQGGSSRAETSSHAAQQSDPRRQGSQQQPLRGDDRGTRATPAGHTSQDATEAAIRQLMAQGYSREEAIRYLRRRRDRGQ